MQATGSTQSSLNPVVESASRFATSQRNDEASIGFLDDELPQKSHDQQGGFYSGSYPPNCWRGIFTLVPNTKRGTELAKRALLAEKREKHLGRWHPYLPTKNWACHTKRGRRKGAGETDTLEPHRTGRNRPRAASCWSQGEQGLKTKLPTI